MRHREIRKRLENEYYTRLSIIELKPLNVTDANGLSRFKCGFFVDNFKTLWYQIGHPDFMQVQMLRMVI